MSKSIMNKNDDNQNIAISDSDCDNETEISRVSHTFNQCDYEINIENEIEDDNDIKNDNENKTENDFAKHNIFERNDNVNIKNTHFHHSSENEHEANVQLNEDMENKLEFIEHKEKYAMKNKDDNIEITNEKCTISQKINEKSKLYSSGNVNVVVDQKLNIQLKDESILLNDQPQSNNDELKLNISESDKKAKVTKKFLNQEVVGCVCDVCCKRVYPMEQLMMDSKCYHKACLKCCKCGKSLNPTVVSKFNNNIFCKPHYIELFRKRGRYDDINIPSEGEPAVSPSYVFEPSSTDKDSQENNVRSDYELNYKEVSGDQPSKDIALKIRVADATKAWTEGRLTNSIEWKRANSNNNNEINELQSVNNGAKVKNLKAMFENN